MFGGARMELARLFETLAAAGPVALVLGFVCHLLWKQNLELMGEIRKQQNKMLRLAVRVQRAVESFVNIGSRPGMVRFGKPAACLTWQSQVDQIGNRARMCLAECRFNVGNVMAGISDGITQKKDAVGRLNDGIGTVYMLAGQRAAQQQEGD